MSRPCKNTAHGNGAGTKMCRGKGPLSGCRPKGQKRCWKRGKEGGKELEKRKNVSAVVRNVTKCDFRVNSLVKELTITVNTKG